MEIVIDVPEVIFNQIKKYGDLDWYNLKRLYIAVQNAVVLPKGHGALKDVDVIKKSWNGLNTPGGMRKVIDLQVLDDATTLIEAAQGGVLHDQKEQG